jgi:hypothetical protein
MQGLKKTKQSCITVGTLGQLSYETGAIEIRIGLTALTCSVNMYKRLTIFSRYKKHDTKYVIILYFMSAFRYCAFNERRMKQNGRIAYLMEIKNA